MTTRRTHTLLPSIKGQITIPPEIRERYEISKGTPLVIEDKGKGVIQIKVMRIVAHDGITAYENDTELGIHFAHGIDPKVVIEAIKKIDG